MSFRDDFRRILRLHPKEIVEGFIDSIKEDYAGGLDEYNPLVHEKYHGSYEAVISDSKDAVEALKQILNEPMYKGTQGELYEAIKVIQNVLDVNEARKPKGHPLKLNKAQKYLLLHLQEEFRRCFPDLASEYKRGTLLRKLGEALLSTTLTDTTDKQITPPNL